MEICCNCGQPVSKMPSDKYAMVIQNVAAKHKITYENIMSQSKEGIINAARQEAYWSLHALGLSSAQVGRIMKRDHTTILHGIKQHEARVLRELMRWQKGPLAEEKNASGPEAIAG